MNGLMQTQIAREFIVDRRPTLREAVVRTLQLRKWSDERQAVLPTSWTVGAVADHLHVADFEVEPILKQLRTLGIVRARLHPRSGELLYRLAD